VIGAIAAVSVVTVVFAATVAVVAADVVVAVAVVSVVALLSFDNFTLGNLEFDIETQCPLAQVVLRRDLELFFRNRDLEKMSFGDSPPGKA
jgi:hypothetical protein